MQRRAIPSTTTTADLPATDLSTTNPVRTKRRKQSLLEAFVWSSRWIVRCRRQRQRCLWILKNGKESPRGMHMGVAATAVVGSCCVLCILLLLLLLLLFFLGGGTTNPSFSWSRSHFGSRQNFNPLLPRPPALLPFHPSVYRVPEAMDIVGDRSVRYAELRREYDTHVVPLNHSRSVQFVQSLSQPPVVTAQGAPYDIYNCTKTPPLGYPYEWNLVKDILNSWPMDETDSIPTNHEIRQGLCVFDYQTDYDKALNYRIHEVPFVVVNDPEVARTVERWHQPGYVEQMLGPTVQHRTEYNTNNHFLYAATASSPQSNTRGGRRRHIKQQQHSTQPNYTDLYGRPAQSQHKDAVPQKMHMTFADWLNHANTTKTGPTEEHWYYRLIGCGLMGNDGGCDFGSTEALFDELPFFQPRPSSQQLYLGDVTHQMGIHCRFGMKGVIAENHFDSSRNAIVVLAGRRRYILSHPDNCRNMALLPPQHPSARHSAVDYSQPNLNKFPEFRFVQSNEVVLQPGQVLYLPTNWFHTIVSLELNYQCNTRSGVTDHYMAPIHECGF